MNEDTPGSIEIWLAALNNYSMVQLTTKPSSSGWSMGQLYNHLVDDTAFYLEQIRRCIASNDNADKMPSQAGRHILDNMGFPKEIIQGSPENAFIQQPGSKKELVNRFTGLAAELKHSQHAVASASFSGKAEHPGFGYFDAREWLRFTEIHFRHHLKQKSRIDRDLNSNALY